MNVVDSSRNRSVPRDRQIERREWWLWGFAVTVTVVLTVGIISLSFPANQAGPLPEYLSDLREWVRGLAALVLLFDIYTTYQHLQLQRTRRTLAERDQLFQLISENAADMIAVVDNSGHRIYNSPAYEKVLGYAPGELSSGSAIDQVHPFDRERVSQASQKARIEGKGERLEYRMRHKDSSWRILESTASPFRNSRNEVEGLVIVNRDITQRKRAEALLAHSAFYDGLTDLPNRDLFLDRLQHALIRARRHADYKFAVLFIDVDDFKVVNDSLGHSAGDELLIQIAKRLTACFRDSDMIARSGAMDADVITHDDPLARLGGDEFTALLEDVFEPSDAIRVAQRIQKKLAVPFAINGHEIVTAVSVGVVLSSNSYVQAADVLRDAEIAMYRAKRSGKGRCEVFDSAMHASALRRLTLETELRRAIELDELKVYYQPIISLESGRVTGFEALSRWQKSEGMVPPLEFIPVADETGLILPINRLLMLEACRQLRLWQSEFPATPPLTMSLNITPRQFAQPELAAEIKALLQQTGVAPDTIHLEITETIAMGDADQALRILSELKAIGVRLSIDDFGTGYSSLSRLPRFPIDALKIDRVFISNINADRDSHEIVRLIIMLAHSLGLKVVAEGTETEAQTAELRGLRCELAQGYLYSPPVAPKSASEILRSNRREHPDLQQPTLA